MSSITACSERGGRSTHVRTHSLTHAPTHSRTHARSHARTLTRMCTHARTCTHARMHARTHARTLACAHARAHADARVRARMAHGSDGFSKASMQRAEGNDGGAVWRFFIYSRAANAATCLLSFAAVPRLRREARSFIAVHPAFLFFSEALLVSTLFHCRLSTTSVTGYCS